MDKTLIGRTFVIINVKGDEPQVVRKFRVSSLTDARAHFAMRDGKPVFGPNVYIELTHKELEKLGKPVGFKREHYFESLVPIWGLEGYLSSRGVEPCSPARS